MEISRNDRGITSELIQDLLNNICLILNITAPIEPIQPVLPENPTEKEQTEYDKAMEQYNTNLTEYKSLKAEYDYNISLLTLYIDMICNNILVKTNRRIFIPELKYVVIDLVKNKFDSNNTTDADLQSIQSMSEYDRTVNFGASDIVKTRLNLIAQKQIEENEKLINKYKLLYRT